MAHTLRPTSPPQTHNFLRSTKAVRLKVDLNDDFGLAVMGDRVNDVIQGMNESDRYHHILEAVEDDFRFCHLFVADAYDNK